MPLYSFRMRDGPTTDPEFAILSFEENSAAIEFAREQLALTPRFLTVDIFVGDTMIALVER